MAKASFGEYSAYETPGGLRFQKKNKLVAEKSVPQEVVSFLRDKLGDDSGKVQAPKFPRPSEEELAKMREESLKVPEELQMSPEELEARTPELTPEDFADAPLPRTDEPDGLPLEPSFIESVSIYTASLEDIAQALYDRFGIYTVYTGTLPQGDDINAHTGYQFTKYHLGIAYQAAIQARSRGLPDPESMKKSIDTSREAHQNFAVDAPARTVGESRANNDFRFRTSVRGSQQAPTTRIDHIRDEDGKIHAVQVPLTEEERRGYNGASSHYDHEEDELIVDPGIGKKVIRPDW